MGSTPDGIDAAHLVDHREDAVQLLLQCSRLRGRELEAGQLGDPGDLFEGKHEKSLLRP